MHHGAIQQTPGEMCGEDLMSGETMGMMLMKDVATNTEHANRRTVSVMDVVNTEALEADYPSPRH